MKNPEKVVSKEQQQIKRLKRMQGRSNSKYFFVLLMLIAIVNILDEVTSNLTVTVQSSFVTEFFVNNPFMGKFYTFEQGLALHSSIGVVTYVFGIITPFYKALADKWGRKPLFALSTLGMATGLIVIHLSTSYIMFLVGFAIISFFMGHDIQIIYILEEAPVKHRAKIYSFLKSFGILGVILIPALRNALIPTTTVIGLQMGSMLGGSVLTESVFSWPGVGRFMIQSIQGRDIPSVMGCVIIFALSFALINLLVDLIYGFIDPRIKAQYK